MPFEIAPLIPVIGTVAAALVAGGIARANLIASKETKISEFRQAWINALRDDLAALFSNTRTLARAVQESRAHEPGTTKEFAIEQSKITAVRHGAAETYHRIRLRLNAGQADHKELLRLLGAMMGAQQSYMINNEGDVAEPIAAVEKAASYAEGVLKTEWETVKFGERAYRAAVHTTTYTLAGSFAVLAVLVVGLPIYVYSSASGQGAKETNQPAAQLKADTVAAPRAASVPDPVPASHPAATAK
jgi:hypothetical protein